MCSVRCLETKKEKINIAKHLVVCFYYKIVDNKNMLIVEIAQHFIKSSRGSFLCSYKNCLRA